MQGKLEWMVPDCYWPEITSEGHYVSHEAICVLNTGVHDAHIDITLYFEDQDPLTGFHALCAASRTNHIRMDRLKNDAGLSVPVGKAYAALVSSDEPIVVQYSRLDTTQPNEALMTAIAFPC